MVLMVGFLIVAKRKTLFDDRPMEISVRAWVEAESANGDNFCRS